MKRIGLLSDTHNYLDDAIFKHFDKCDEIWHGGDFGTAAVAEQLEKYKPLKGVYGNIDGYDIRSRFPEVLQFSCEDVKVLMIHIEIISFGPKLFISGHSHILKIMYDGKFKCLHINPGAAGKQGWHKVRTLVRFVIDGENIKDCEVIELGSKGMGH